MTLTANLVVLSFERRKTCISLAGSKFGNGFFHMSDNPNRVYADAYASKDLAQGPRPKGKKSKP